MKNNCEKWKKKLKIPLWVSSLVFIVFLALDIVILSTSIGKKFPELFKYFSFAISAVSLAFLIVGLYHAFKQKRLIKKVTALAEKWSFTNRMIHDYSFRTLVFAFGSLCTNAFFAITKGFAGWYSSSFWLITLSIYYLILCILKFFLLQNSRKIQKTDGFLEQQLLEWKAYRMTGILLLC